jgi:hypothetical protein
VPPPSCAELEEVKPPHPPSPRRCRRPPAHRGRGGEAAPAQGVIAARGGRACSCKGSLFVNEVVPQGFGEASKGGRSSQGPTTQSSAADDREGLHLQDQFLGWRPTERSARPSDDDNGDDGGLDISGSDSNSDGGAPPAATTSA